MKLTTRLAKSQLKGNIRRTTWTLIGIILATAMITAVYGLIASTLAIVTTIWEGAVLRLYYEAMLASLGTILSFVIVTSSIIVLSNAFRVSANERAKQFGILKSVGATKQQISQIVVKESILLATIGIPVGIVMGLIIQFIGIIIINYFLIDLFRAARPGENMTVRFVISWLALVLSVGISFITVTLSAWLPARKAAKVPAIDAIRGAGEIRQKDKKIPARKLVGKIFGIEGLLAAKSVRRNRRNFRATVITLSLSVAIFITLGSFVTQMNRLIGLTFPDIDADVIVSFFPHTHWVYDDDGVLDRIESNALTREESEEIARLFEAYTGAPIFTVDSAPFTYTTEISLEMLSPEGLERHNLWGSNDRVLLVSLDPINYEILANRAGVPLGSNILVNHNRVHTQEGRRWEFEPIRFAGQTLELTNTYTSETRDLPLHGVLGIGQVPNEIMHIGTHTITVIVPELNSTIHRWFISTDDPMAFLEYARDLTIEMGLTNGSWNLFNIHLEQEAQRALATLVVTFVWGFVVFLTLIYLTNIISTITANVQARGQEFAILQSVGMTRGSLMHMLRIESALSSIKSLFIGIPLGLLGAYLVHNAIARAATFAFGIVWGSVGISIIAVFALTWIVMGFAVASMRGRNIVETIRRESGM